MKLPSVNPPSSKTGEREVARDYSSQEKPPPPCCDMCLAFFTNAEALVLHRGIHHGRADPGNGINQARLVISKDSNQIFI